MKKRKERKTKQKVLGFSQLGRWTGICFIGWPYVGFSVCVLSVHPAHSAYVFSSHVNKDVHPEYAHCSSSVRNWDFCSLARGTVGLNNSM